MAHELLIGEDGEASMMYVDAVPWHQLGQKLEEPPTAAEAIAAARLDWEVAKAPLFYHASIARTGLAPNVFALVPGERWPHSTLPVFGVVTSKYRVLQNREAFAFFDPIVKRGYATYETAGALGEGERVWVMAKLRKNIRVADGDEVQRYLLLANSHDGKASVQVKFTPVRVVCQNTLSMALGDELATFAVRHDPSLFENLDDVADAMIDRIEHRYEAIASGFVRMAGTPVDEARLQAYLNAVFPLPAAPVAGGGIPAHKERVALAMRGRWAGAKLYRTSPRCVSAGRTLWALYNAVTEYVDHWRPANSRGRAAGTQLGRIWFGGGYRVKLRAFEVAMSMCVN